MLDRYVVKDGKKMKYGYTTGSCAAAASKAAVVMIVNQKTPSKVSIDTPKGWRLNLDVINPKIINEISGKVFIKKDGGDDPDITNGILVGAKVEITDNTEIIIKGGTGVGLVTKPGLYVEVGSPAINPIPQKMIRDEVKKVLPKGKGAIITIIVPKGEEVSKKTFNPKLGIIGGISILGTSGIVEPMSEEAFKESLAMELKMALKDGIDKVVLVPGNYGEEKAKNYFKIDDKLIIKTSNFVGFMLDKCIELGIKEVLFIGHIGKLVKLSGGIFNTHSKLADARLEILVAYLALIGASKEIVEKVFECVTTEGAVKIIDEYGYEKVYSILTEKAEKRCSRYTYDNLKVGIIMFSMDSGILSIGEIAKEILEEF